MNYVMLGIFIVSTTIHLYASLKKDQKLRNITKPFILLALLGFYLCEASNIYVTVILALIFSWLGDVFLMGKGVKYFTIGGIAFMIGHFFFCLSYLKDIDFSSINPIVIAFFAAIFIIAVVIIFSKLRAFLPKALFYPMFAYLLINGTMNCFAIYRLFTLANINTIVTVIGAVLFFISDSSLFFVRFNKDGKLQSHFLVMLTYSLGEFLIVLGLL